MLRPKPGVVWVPSDVLESIVGEADRVAPLETGGVLLGYWSVVGQELVITAATGPGPRASHRPKGFDPDSEYHRLEIARLYAQSGRLHGYVGDWHTHPAGGYHPSRLDRRTLQRIARSPGARAPVPVMAILGEGPEGANGWRLAIWRLVRWKDWLEMGVTSVTCLTIRQYRR